MKSCKIERLIKRPIKLWSSLIPLNKAAKSSFFGMIVVLHQIHVEVQNSIFFLRNI